MAINAPQTADNGAVGSYWRLNGAELLCSPRDPVPQWKYTVGFYASEAARDKRPDLPMWNETILIPLAAIVGAGGEDPRPEMYRQIMLMPPFLNTNAAADTEVSEPKPLIPPELLTNGLDATIAADQENK
jgi:hypothetical protein